MEFGVCLPIFGGVNDSHPRTPLVREPDWKLNSKIVSAAERYGYDSLWVADHLMLGAADSILECWTALSALSTLTRRMRLGTIHICNIFRNPALLAKIAATLDFISGGRLDFFIEAGHRGSIREAESYGYLWPEDDARVGMLDESLEIVKALWQGKPLYFKGKYYSVKGAVCRPTPRQIPRPPIWIGTIGGEKFTTELGMDDKMMDVIARHADVWNNTPAPPSHCLEKISELRKACIRNNRDFNSIELSLESQILVARTEGSLKRKLNEIHKHNPSRLYYGDERYLRETYVIGTPEDCIKKIKDYRRIGITKFLLWFIDMPSVDGLELFAEEVISAVKRR